MLLPLLLIILQILHLALVEEMCPRRSPSSRGSSLSWKQDGGDDLHSQSPVAFSEGRLLSGAVGQLCLSARIKHHTRTQTQTQTQTQTHTDTRTHLFSRHSDR